MLDVQGTQRVWPVISRQMRPDQMLLFSGMPPAISVADALKLRKDMVAGKLRADSIHDFIESSRPVSTKR